MNKRIVKKAQAVSGEPKTTQEKSMLRTEALANNLFEAIEKTGLEVEGDLTVSEVLDVLLRIGHNFNKRALLSEFEDDAIVVNMNQKTDS
jgi:hypothetical protein